MVLFLLVLSMQGRAQQVQDSPQPMAALPQGNKSLNISHKVEPEADQTLKSLAPAEMKWFQRFQEGVPFFDGWKKITQMVVERFPEHERDQIKVIMHALGHKIGSEWSRDNRVRRVNTDMLRVWGKDLRKAGAENHTQLAKIIYKIDSEMNSLLHKEEQITSR